MTKYTEDFKEMIVELNQTGRSVQGLAKEYDISEATIYKWTQLYLPNQSTALTGKENFGDFFDYKQRYGATKIYQVLLKESVRVSLKHVQKLMGQLGLRSIAVKNINLNNLVIQLFQEKTQIGLIVSTKKCPRY